MLYMKVFVKINTKKNRNNNSSPFFLASGMARRPWPIVSAPCRPSARTTRSLRPGRTPRRTTTTACIATTASDRRSGSSTAGRRWRMTSTSGTNRWGLAQTGSLHREFWCRVPTAQGILMQGPHCLGNFEAGSPLHREFWGRVPSAQGILRQGPLCTGHFVAGSPLHRAFWGRVPTAQGNLRQGPNCTENFEAGSPLHREFWGRVPTAQRKHGKWPQKCVVSEKTRNLEILPNHREFC